VSLEVQMENEELKDFKKLTQFVAMLLLLLGGGLYLCFYLSLIGEKTLGSIVFPQIIGLMALILSGSYRFKVFFVWAISVYQDERPFVFWWLSLSFHLGVAVFTFGFIRFLTNGS
jgi:hypothetical protein